VEFDSPSGRRFRKEVKMREILNARITDTMLGYEDHGILTFSIFLDCGRYSTAFGGYCLDSYDNEKKCRIHSKYLGISIEKILKVAGVERWEDLKGKYVRLEREDKQLMAPNGSEKLIHVLDDRIYFCPNEALDVRGEKDD
jgi:hypothetical protein